jgi:hypothetical protein
MKRTSNYKMSKKLKSLLALLPFPSKTEKSGFKNNMINAEIYAGTVERGVLGGKNTD